MVGLCCQTARLACVATVRVVFYGVVLAMPVAALFYSLIESARLCGVEPRACLREATLRAVRNPGTVTLARDLESSEA